MLRMISHLMSFMIDTSSVGMFQVSLFQLEKMFGKGKDAKEFISELCKGHLAQFICEHSPCCIFMFPKNNPHTIETAAGYSGQVGTPHPQAPGG